MTSFSCGHTRYQLLINNQSLFTPENDATRCFDRKSIFPEKIKKREKCCESIDFSRLRFKCLSESFTLKLEQKYQSDFDGYHK